MPIILNGTTGITTPGITNTGTFTFQGVVELPAGAVGAPSLTTTGDTNTGIYFPAANQVAIATDGAQRVFIGATGDVGIGTSSPATKLHVKDTTNTAITIQGDSSAGAANLLFSADSNITKAAIVGAKVGGTSGNLSFQTLTSGSLTTKAVIDDSGNLGLGTSNPGQKLEVAGNIFVNTSGNPYMEVKTSGAGNNPYLRLTADTNNWTIQGTFSNANDELFFMNNSNTRMAITSGGDVGIGTTSPATKLDVRGIVYTDNQYRVGTNSAGANTGIIKWNAGNSLGIYTWSDALNIEIGGSNVIFKPESGSERARITSGGNLLVGMTTTPNISVSNSIGHKGAANGIAGSVNMSGSTWVDLVTLPTPSIAGGRVNILGNENSNTNTYYGMWVIAYNSSGWGITGPFNENQRGNDYGVPNLRISGGKIQVQARNGVSSGLIYYNIEYFSV